MRMRSMQIVCLMLIFVLFESGFSQAKKRGAFAWALRGDFRPFVEASVGIGQPQHKDFTTTFAKYGLAEARVGYSEIVKFRKAVYEMDERYIFGNYLSSDADFLEDKSGDIKSEATRFGFGSRLGYGYDLGPIVLLPYNQSQLVFTKFETTRPDTLSVYEESELNRYEGRYRFGVATEGGVKLEIFKSLSVTGSYELAVVYPTVVFWPWLGSYLILQSGLGMVSTFSEDIVKSSPIFGPIMYFALKNGLSYLFFKGLQSRMYWPFASNPPLTMETFKIGASIRF